MIVVKQKNKIIRYCAGVAFLLLAILELKNRLSFWGVVFAIGFAITGVSFLVKKPVLATVGGIILLAGSLISDLTDGYISSLFWCIGAGAFLYPILELLGIATNVLFVILTINGKKQLGYAATATCVIGYLARMVFFHSYLSLYMIVRIASLFLAGLAYEDMPAKVKKTVSNMVHISAADKIQHLEKLYDLLEKGILTQEEFEAKKKQLLNL